MLRKYEQDPSHVLDYEMIELREDFTYLELPIRILDQKELTLRNKTIPLVKMLQQYHAVEEGTWKREEETQDH